MQYKTDELRGVMIDQIRDEAIKALDAGSEGVLGLRKRWGQIGPYLFKDAKDLEEIEIDPKYSLAKTIVSMFEKQPDLGLLGVVLRGCDVRALRELEKAGKINFEKLNIIGIACSLKQAAECNCEKPEYDTLNCVGCWKCMDACRENAIERINICPVLIPDQFNEGLSNQKAINITYPQAVPLKAAKDQKHCLKLKDLMDCKGCETACKAEAILNEDEEILEDIEVGAIVVSAGFDLVDPKPLKQYGYGAYPNVVTSMEFERILSAGGPFKGHITRFSDGAEPKKIAWLQCVGSRSIQENENAYCSSVCCMYALKQSMIAKDHIGPDLDTTIFYMDIRSHRKDFEKYYERTKKQGVRLVRARVHTINSINNNGDLSIRYVTEDGAVQDETFDMAVLSVGLKTAESTLELADSLGIDLGPNKFIDTSCFAPANTSVPGVYACGVATGPKDIPQSVIDGSAVASAATSHLAGARGVLVKKKVFPIEKDVNEADPRIGVFVCNCGANIGGIADVPDIVEYAKGLPNVEYATDHLFSCSQDSQDKMIKMIEENDLNRVVVASCSPRTHQPIFQEMLRNAGLNKYLFEMANIRNQCTWVHQNEPEKATKKCKDLVNMAVAKARLIQPLDYITVDVEKRALVIGGGVAGMRSAVGLADQGYEVHLVEKSGMLGGQALKLHKTWKGEDIGPYVNDLIKSVQSNDQIVLHMGTTVEEATGFTGNFLSKLADGDEISHGVVILATGAEAYQPGGQYLFGENPNVMHLLDMDAEIMLRSERIRNAETIAFIQCVGSRIPERPYCNKICCSHSVENALKLKEMNPDLNIYILYRDMRTYGERELLYKAAREKGVIFIRYKLDQLPRVEADAGKIKITVDDHILKKPVEIAADLLALATAIVPHDNTAIANLYKVPLNAEGFFSEVHAKIKPLDCATDGIYLAGLCHFPKPIEESIAEGQAAASRASSILSRDFLEMESTISNPVDENCDGCAFCIDPCPYGALTLVEYMKNGEVRKTVEVNEVLCKGCGSCMATCPKQGIFVNGFSQKQFNAQVEAAIGLI